MASKRQKREDKKRLKKRVNTFMEIVKTKSQIKRAHPKQVEELQEKLDRLHEVYIERLDPPVDSTK